MTSHSAQPAAVSTALRILTDALGDCVHRDGQPAIMHSMRVALAQDTEEGVILGLLHDVMEDAGLKWGVRIKNELGERMFYLVSLATRGGEELYDEYVERIIASGEIVVMKMKLDDLRDNMRPERSDEKARQRAVMYGRSFDLITAAIA